MSDSALGMKVGAGVVVVVEGAMRRDSRVGVLRRD